MRRTRLEQKAQRARDDRAPILPLDARDADILRAKQRARSLRSRA